MDQREGRPKLRLLQGGLAVAEARRKVAARIVVARSSEAPFTPDAVVVEQDRDLVLAPPRPAIAEPEEHVGRLMMRVMNQPRRSPGGVVVAGGLPLTLFAVVHDIDEDPTWREEWVAGALRELFAFAARHQLARMAMPLLGTVHGRMPPARAVELLVTALAAAGDYPRRLWLQCEADQVRPLRTLLRSGA